MKKVFPRYQDKTLDNYTVTTPVQEKAVEVVRNYITDLADMKDQGMGITFGGQSGVGKTHLACAVLNAASFLRYKIECVELGNLIEMHQELFGMAQSNDEDEQERRYAIRRRLQYIKGVADFLLLDDLGRESESQSGWSNEQVFDLLRHRSNRLMPTIITTNVPLVELERRYTEGLSSLLHEATFLVEVDGEDYRCAMGS